MTWEVPYQEGTLEAIAYDKNGNKIEKTQGRSVVKTTGKKSNLSAKADRSEITADGKDLAYVEVDVRDADGNIIPNAEDRVTFKVEGNGELVGVDNGSAPDHDSCLLYTSFFSPAFFMITALPPVAIMVEIAVTKEMIGADKLIADKAFVPIRLETNKPSTIV